MTLTQKQRNDALLDGTPGCGSHFTAAVIDVGLSALSPTLTDSQRLLLNALEIEAARIAIQSVGELSKLNETDHLGGGLDLIPALVMTLAMVDYERVDFTIEHAHTSIGYYGTLAAYGHLDRDRVISAFRQSLDIAGHVSWVPGGTQLSGGRLGVMVPTAVGQALGRRARHGKDAWVICHCGDAGWISGQALNGFNAAHVHGAPVTFVMHRNGIQLSGTTNQVMNLDPRPIIRGLGIEIIEISSLHNIDELYAAYAKGRALCAEGRPNLIYPTGHKETLHSFATRYHLESDVDALAAKGNVDTNREVWIPGSMMSFREAEGMTECVFYVNSLAGGKGHHDGHLKGRNVEKILAHPLLTLSTEQSKALASALRYNVTTKARPAPGSPNLQLPAAVVAAAKLPAAGTTVSPRAGVQEAYGLLARAFPNDMFVIDCDLAPSTKVDTARKILAPDHQFELSIEEQIATMMANGLAMSSNAPQLTIFATFAAFFEGIAREGFEMWRYQRNLNGVNEGLNVTFHLSHVGANTGRDHFSGWSLDWINLAIGYLPYLDRFYAPADARSAFVAVRDLAARYGAHILAIPRDNLPILTKPDGKTPVWNADSTWQPISQLHENQGAQKAILGFGATAYLALEASSQLLAEGEPVDVYVITGLPFGDGEIASLLKRYPKGLVTVEDGLIGPISGGVRGFAGLVRTSAYGSDVPLAHIGIEDPRIAPSDGHPEVWEHFGITREAIMNSVRNFPQ
jgi:transketolase